MSFSEDGTPQPKNLGTTKSRADIKEAQDSIPPRPSNHGEPPPHATQEQLDTFAAFGAKCEIACDRSKRSKAAIKSKKAQDRLLILQDWCKQLRRVQRYFGLREPTPKAPVPDPSLGWAEQQAFQQNAEKKLQKLPEPLDVTQLAPFKFEKQPIIISVDVESYERDHSIKTEIGISTLDTLDLVGIPPGRGGDNWTKQIRSRHFRISGRERYVNKDFCPGDGNSFQFGESEFVRVGKVGDAIDECLQWPFSVRFKHDGKLKWQPWKDAVAAATEDAYAPTNGQTKTTDSEAEPKTDAKPVITSSKNGTTTTQVPSSHIQLGGQERTIILVGHDICGDLKDLASLDSAVFSRPRPPVPYPDPLPGSFPEDDEPLDERAAKGKKISDRILEALDTATLYQTLTKGSQTRNLTSVILDLERSGWFMVGILQLPVLFLG